MQRKEGGYMKAFEEVYLEISEVCSWDIGRESAIAE
jgi:hypothetical protein